jgi:hypothetical protein
VNIDLQQHACQHTIMVEHAVAGCSYQQNTSTAATAGQPAVCHVPAALQVSAANPLPVLSGLLGLLHAAGEVECGEVHRCFPGSFYCFVCTGHISIAWLLHTSTHSSLASPARSTNMSLVARACSPGKSLITFSKYCCCYHHELDHLNVQCVHLD